MWWLHQHSWTLWVEKFKIRSLAGPPSEEILHQLTIVYWIQHANACFSYWCLTVCFNLWIDGILPAATFDNSVVAKATISCVEYWIIVACSLAASITCATSTLAYRHHDYGANNKNIVSPFILIFDFWFFAVFLCCFSFLCIFLYGSQFCHEEILGKQNWLWSICDVNSYNRANLH